MMPISKASSSHTFGMIDFRSDNARTRLRFVRSGMVTLGDRRYVSFRLLLARTAVFVSQMLVELVSRRECLLASSTGLIYWSDEEAMSFCFWLELFLRRFVVVFEVLVLFGCLSGGGVAAMFVVVFITVIHPSSFLLEVISTLVTKVLIGSSVSGVGVFALERL